MKPVVLLVALLGGLAAQGQTVNLNPEADAQEQSALQQALGEAGNSPIDRIRALEEHLKKYPGTKQRAAIEQALVQSAIETNDNPRLILYGERVLQMSPAPDSNEMMIVLDRVIRALVNNDDRDRAQRAVALARRYEADVDNLRSKAEPPGHLTPAQWSEELDRAMARALALDARATGNLGRTAEARKLAGKSWEAYPSGEGARETAYWLTELGDKAEAIEYYADAFTLEDSHTTAADRAVDRQRLGDLYTELNGSEKGLGDAILAAYDRTSALMAARRAVMKAKDPNSLATKIEEFTLPAVDPSAPALVLSSLKGKTVVMDFWATWCVPCRAQKPLIEEVESQYKDSPNVIFVAVNADDDRSLVAPFLKDQKWQDHGYFEAGLARQLVVSSIPTVLVLDSAGNVSSRMIGFIPDRFKDMLRERIEDALAKK